MQDAPLREWAGATIQDPGCREEYLTEMLRPEGRGDRSSNDCMSCFGEGGVYRCKDCMGRLMECFDCCLKRHEHLPLHIIQVCFSSLDLSAFLFVLRSGTTLFLRRSLSDQWGCESSLATLIRLACYLTRATRTSRSSIPTAYTMWLWISVAATNALSQIGNSSSARNGSLRPSINHRPAQHFGSWNSSMSSP